ncbi:hypothetical protein E3V55_07030 [Candidatus Marinimicrobia bacterium MT.SAG.3]|nr:hypothetical protein E3V55_07030 [Candidatus Marinimicrobia bacterium MT.SAG.3]
MGTGFTIDTPVRIAKLGISSVISIIDDMLTEQMRKYHAERAGESYEEIPRKSKDSRVRRIREYLNLVHRIVQKETGSLKKSPFEPGSDITRYYEMLPDSSLKIDYLKMLNEKDPKSRERMQNALREKAVPGEIDVNIMTKIDRSGAKGNEELPTGQSDALLALRGFAESTLNSSVIFSAGLNPRLYAYIANFSDFFPNKLGEFKKKITLKISDFRSGAIQGKFLARKGLWISEFRIESGLNCGGHAFATKGNLMGPILEEFKEQRDTLKEKLFEAYTKGLKKLGKIIPTSPPEVRLTVQGGIGTNEERNLLHDHYKVNTTGWATPFLLVSEVTNLDEDHRDRLASAGEDDVLLSDASPLGLPFWVLKNSAAVEEQNRLIDIGKPGSDCPKGFLISNSEFTKHHICSASRNFMRRKLNTLETNGSTENNVERRIELVLAKACLCRDLAASATQPFNVKRNGNILICCGPGITNFSKKSTLEEMVDHIYGRISLLTDPNRPHMFIKELSLYVEYIRKEAEQYKLDLSSRTPKYFREFKDNIKDGIEYYRTLVEEFMEDQRVKFLTELDSLSLELDAILTDKLLELQPVEAY